MLWGILASLGHKLRSWVVPLLVILVIAANLWTLGGWRGADDYIERPLDYFPPLLVSIPDGARAVLSIPVWDTNPEFLVVFNEHDEPLVSKFNPITNTIDARIHENGIYFLRAYESMVATLGNVELMMREAIMRLVATGIMRTDNSNLDTHGFITRAEFASALVLAFDMLDTLAENPFIDVTPADWYYHAAATVYRHNLMRGFDDFTFDGHIPITKDEIALGVAGVMMRRMGYYAPYDIEGSLSHFHDRSRIEPWLEPAVALVTDANILLFREDEMFAPGSYMTRGDAAIVLYRLMGRLW